MKSTSVSQTTHNIWIQVIRALAVAFIVLCTIIFLGALLNAPAYLRLHPEIIAPEGWTAEQTLERLANVHISLDTWIYATLISQVFVAIVFCAIGTLILLRRSNDWFGLYVGVEFWLFGTQASDIQFIFGEVYPEWQILALLLAQLAWFAFFPIFYLFPDGKFVPRWTRWLALLWFGLFIWTTLVPTAATVNNLTLVAMAVGLAATGAWSQFYRYRRHSDPVQRQQTKWVLYAVLVMTLIVLGVYLPTLFTGVIDWSSETAQFYYLFAVPIGFALVTLVPLSIGIAILRYRLWDIDILIRKTLVYGLVVALLAIVYFGSVILLQQIFASLTGQRDEIITVLSTLAIAALFVPLRNKIQDLIDRRFYRKKYDAQQVLSKFSETVRDETDLERLTGRLVEVVQETMQPKSVEVWLRPESEHGKD